MKRIFLTLTFILFIIPFGISQDLPSYVPADGLVAFYPFNGNANDESGNGNHGTVNGATLSSDRYGNTDSAYNFEGINCCGTPDNVQEIKITNSLLNLSENYTISCWMNSSSTTKFQQALFLSYNEENGNGFGVQLNNEHVPNKLTYAIGPAKLNTNWDVLYAVGDFNSFENEKWYNVVFVKNGTDYKLYLNGEVDGTTNLPASNDYTQDVGLIIGSIGSGYEVFNGTLDDYGIWNRALTENEIQNLYTSSTGDILLNGVVSAENNQIKNLEDPTHQQDAVTKNYVDSNVNSFSGSYNDLTDTPTSSNAFQLPLVTTNQRDEITPQSGMMVYNIDVHEFQGFQNYEKIHPAEIDQQHVTINNGGGENRAQSFTAGVTGELELVKLPLNVMMEPMELLFKIIDGEGVDGNVLFQISYDLTNSNQDWIEFSISGVDVISGNKYTIQLVENSGCGMPPCYNWGMDTSGDNYIGGQFFYNGTPYSNGEYDSAFITYVSLREAVNEWRTLN